MPENTNTEETITPEVAPVEATPVETPVETAAAADYSKYASMAETPSVNERRTFDFLAVSGAVETEIITGEDGTEMEKRKPATAYKLFLTRPKVNDRFESEAVALPVSIVPIKYRVVLEQRTGSKGETLVLKSSEFNGKMSDTVVISRFSPDGKVVEKYGPMSVADARKTFKNAEGKGVLRDKAHIYALHNGEVIRFVVKGAGLWEDRKGLVNGKTEASKKEYPFLTEYLATFPMTEPYFLYEMSVGAAYRDHGSVKFYRPTFERGARISPEVEKVVLENLEDLHKYFVEQDAEVAKFVAQTATPTTVVTEADEMQLDENGNPVFQLLAEDQHFMLVRGVMEKVKCIQEVVGAHNGITFMKKIPPYEVSQNISMKNMQPKLIL